MHLIYLRLSPRHFGEPTSRDRLWRILMDPLRVYWNCQFSFEELRDILLMPAGTPLKLTPRVFETATSAEVVPSELCPSAQRHLEFYEELEPEKQWYDLSSNPHHRKRTETADGALFTLTTNSHIWSLAICNIENFRTCFFCCMGTCDCLIFLSSTVIVSE